MEFLNLPVELIYSNLLPYLKWNDLIKFRRVNKAMRKHVDIFIIEEFTGVPERIEIEINEHSKSWYDIDIFLNLDFSASNFYLNNPSGPEFFEESGVSPFLKLYRHQITKLRLQKISTCPINCERQFYETLKNLQSLTIESVIPGQSAEETNPNICWSGIPNPFKIRSPFRYIKIRIPRTFENLKYLKISDNPNQNTNSKKKQISGVNMLAFNVSFLRNCLKLEEVALGSTANQVGSGCSKATIIFGFLEIFNHLQIRAREFPSEPNLKYFDFKNYNYINRHIVRQISPSFLELCRVFFTHQVKIRNIPANLFKAFHPQFHHDDIISSVVESMEGLHPVVLGLELPHLTSLSIPTTFQTSFRGGQLPFRTEWPSLENLKLFINTKNLWACTRNRQKIPSMPVSELYDLLFGSRANRGSLKFLRIHFSSRMMDTLSRDLQTFPCPRIRNIVSSCPNITKLEIINWPDGNNLNFGGLWKGLRGLEEIRLTKCKLIGDETFIGEDEESPVFLQLKNLKKLWLVDLDKMPMITDKSFLSVFRHLKLTDFILYSDKPMKNITQEGILSLLSGDFAISIEKFPFGFWSLSNVDQKELNALHRKFH